MDADKKLLNDNETAPLGQLEQLKLELDIRGVTQDRLATRFKINSEFIRVPVLSKILGISSNAIYAQMRNRTFPVAHTRVGNVVLVKFIDFIDWYCADGILGCVKPAPSQSSQLAMPMIPHSDIDAAAVAVAVDIQLFKIAETPKERSARIKQAVLAGMRARRRT